MRTTLNLEDQLMKEIKRKAAERGVTLTAIIQEALREYLRWSEERRAEPFRLRLVTVEGGPRPGVDLDDRDALYETMEERS